MRGERHFSASSRHRARRWWTTTTWNSYGRSPEATKIVSVLSIPVLLISACANAQEIPSDYRAWLDAETAQKAGRDAEALQLLEKVWSFRPESPLVGKAALLAARSHINLGQAANALSALRARYTALPQPEGDALAGQAAEAAMQPAIAVDYWQRVYYGYPLSRQAADAEAALARLSAMLGSNFPPAMPEAVLSRAGKLRAGGQAARATRELLAAAPGFAGLDRDLALVRANYGNYAALAALRLTAPEADAERLYLMHSAARADKNELRAGGALRQLEERFPQSRWTLEALVSWGNHFLLRNDSADAERHYRACFERFPSDPRAPYCHWKVTWMRWMQRAPDARRWMEEHAERFPASEKRSAALYFLGRYAEILQRHPMSWYAVLAREKAPAANDGASWDPKVFTPAPEMRTRIARARQLHTAGMPEWAEFELKFAAPQQPYVAAMELADVASSRGAHDQALRYIKTIARDYLGMPYEAAPERFWRYAFPLPWRNELERHSRANDLDPMLVAALIRQESEFNPRAVSRAKAYGLTQVLPSTGRQIGRRLGLGVVTPARLFDPDVNLRLGTSYLRSMMNAHAGRPELTLASYNAGKTRTDLWQTWYTYREPAEFVETIPFTETRNYVQIVLRNADVYRRLYGGGDAIRATR